MVVPYKIAYGEIAPKIKLETTLAITPTILARMIGTCMDLIKIEKKKVPARKASRGVPNPFKPGELMDIAARPATTKVKVRALKSLKDMV